ncbi:MAG: UDP-glucose 4-epimerase GalE [Flavobacteriales bacterium]|nr:UDP-glucose 4-epimerase GalE [Flavobacteriales bacterium]
MRGKVIVTGGAGFIGSHTVVELAQAGFLPVIVDDLRNSEERALDGIAAIIGRRPPLYRVDCVDADAMEGVFAEEGAVHGVVHFAADKAVGESVREPLKYYRNNIGSLVTLLEVMRAHAVDRIVFSSSCTVYGQPERLPVDESAPDRAANSPYGFTKMACEQMLRDQCVADPALRAVLLRYFNPIGAHPSAHIGELPLGVPNNLVPFVTQTAAGLRDRLTVFGDDYDTPDGSCVRDYIHVVDLARAHVRALTWMDGRGEAGCEVFNVGTGRGHSVLEVVRRFQEVNGVEMPWSMGPRRPGDVASVYADTTRCRTVLGWEAELGLDDALRDAWRWQCRLGGVRP